MGCNQSSEADPGILQTEIDLINDMNGPKPLPSAKKQQEMVDDFINLAFMIIDKDGNKQLSAREVKQMFKEDADAVSKSIGATRNVITENAFYKFMIGHVTGKLKHDQLEEMCMIMRLGLISRQHVVASKKFQDDLFDSLDTDNSNTLELSELAALGSEATNFLANLDGIGGEKDGKISRGEFVEWAKSAGQNKDVSTILNQAMEGVCHLLVVAAATRKLEEALVKGSTI